MVVECKYIADDGKVFDNEESCRDYEALLRREKNDAILNEMSDLDIAIYSKYYPESDDLNKVPPLHLAGCWLKSDIVSILCDENIDEKSAKDDIMLMISSAKYSKEIFSKYIDMADINEEVEIRRDYFTAFSKVSDGGDLGHSIRYSLGKSDLNNLARLHKSNKCRRKIEALLTCCNFHYECGKFIRKDYCEFLL